MLNDKEKRLDEMEMTPEPYGSAFDRAQEIDRLFFENNPEKDDYVRKAIPFEHPNCFEARFTQVIEIEKGVRVRIPLEYRTQYFDAAVERGKTVKDFFMTDVMENAKGIAKDEYEELFRKFMN